MVFVFSRALPLDGAFKPKHMVHMVVFCIGLVIYKNFTLVLLIQEVS